MTKRIHFLLLFFLYLSARGQTGAAALIPAPLSVQEHTGFFKVLPQTSITAPAVFAQPAAFLAQQLGLRRGSVAAKQYYKNTTGKIILFRASPKDTLGEEGYKLSITPATIVLSAQTTHGSLRGIFSLLQLKLLQPDQQSIPCAVITDKPRFAYRGLQLDVSRSFYPISFIKKYIDLMALYKYNTFHWHLTDNGGWRLQIKKYPELTAAAAFRTRNNWKDWWLNGRKYMKEGEPGAYGGYYTQEEAKSVVAYAAERGITVIPEIEMPGHSEEVLAVYPQLSCSGLPYKNAELCIGNEASFDFLENVLTEVMDIFPSSYIHVGGDEANADAWKNCAKCQARRKKEGLKDEQALQGYLIKRIGQFLMAHKRKLLGWDEIMEGGLAPGTMVMAWRGERNGIEAAAQNHPVIMTPNECYFDAYQSDPNTQPEAIGGYLPIRRVYDYEPVPLSMPPAKARYITGTQANVWTEYMPTSYQVEYMVYPRAIALSEVAWTAKEKKSFTGFEQRLQQQYRLLQKLDVNYYRPSNLLMLKTLPDTIKKQEQLSFTSEQYQPVIHFTTDGSDPQLSSPVYREPFYAGGKTTVKAVIFKDSSATGPPSVFTSNYHKAIGKKVKFNTLWSDSYPAQGESTLTNGIEGSLTYGDKQWLGFLNDFDVTIDMEIRQPLNSLSIRFMQQPGPGVFLPGSVEVLLSADGVHFDSVGKQVNTIPANEPRTIFQPFIFDLHNSPARYIRIVAPNSHGGFMFTDEAIVY